MIAQHKTKAYKLSALIPSTRMGGEWKIPINKEGQAISGSDLWTLISS